MKPYQDFFADHVTDLMRSDPKVVAITAAMLEGTSLNRVQQVFPSRVYDVGIAEQHGVTFAAGLACEGLHPIAAIYSTFLQRAYDQLIHDVALQNLPVTFALDRGGIVGADGATHQGAYDLAYLRVVPNMVVMAPGDENEMRHMLYTAVNRGGPSAVRFPRGSGVGVALDSDFKSLPIGKGRVVRGDIARADVALLGLGSMLHPSLAAAEKLDAQGIRAVVIDPALRQTARRGIDRRGGPRGGPARDRQAGDAGRRFRLGGAGAVRKWGLTGIKVRRLGMLDENLEHGDAGKQKAQLGLDAAGIALAALGLCEGGEKPVKTAG